jgi:perosamine synthetase
VFSCHHSKFIITGESGLVTNNNTEWYEWMNSYKHFGMIMSGTAREGIQFVRPETNYKLSNILKAVALSQMKQIDELLNRRRALTDNYIKMLRYVEVIELQCQHYETLHSYQTFFVLVENRDYIMPEMRAIGIEVQIYTYSCICMQISQKKIIVFFVISIRVVRVLMQEP